MLFVLLRYLYDPGNHRPIRHPPNPVALFHDWNGNGFDPFAPAVLLWGAILSVAGIIVLIISATTFRARPANRAYIGAAGFVWLSYFPILIDFSWHNYRGPMLAGDNQSGSRWDDVLNGHHFDFLWLMACGVLGAILFVAGSLQKPEGSTRLPTYVVWAIVAILTLDFLESLIVRLFA